LETRDLSSTDQKGKDCYRQDKQAQGGVLGRFWHLKLIWFLSFEPMVGLSSNVAEKEPGHNYWHSISGYQFTAFKTTQGLCRGLVESKWQTFQPFHLRVYLQKILLRRQDAGSRISIQSHLDRVGLASGCVGIIDPTIRNISPKLCWKKIFVVRQLIDKLSIDSSFYFA
jgi:hypothetical protein